MKLHVKQTVNNSGLTGIRDHCHYMKRFKNSIAITITWHLLKNATLFGFTNQAFSENLATELNITT